MMQIDTEQLQLEMMKKGVLSKILDKAAVERLGRVRMANPVLASQIEIYLLQLYQSGKLKETITDNKLRQILDLLTEKRKTTIKRR
ncbi:MAG: DNA-binding protein [Candidatus Aenigmatarchaeota archaeon]|nr:DNA-binding protein [Candidatus Aenigmarchaeota archaeon]